MKTREGFVSNSSSSIFVIIGSSDGIRIPDLPEHFIVDRFTGNIEYGWEFEKYYTFGDRLCFAYLQADSMREGSDEGKKWKAMIEKVLKDCAGVKTIEWKISSKYDNDTLEIDSGYIDHQSCCYEGANREIFENEEELIKFLFSKYSVIECGNDNE